MNYDDKLRDMSVNELDKTLKNLQKQMFFITGGHRHHMLSKRIKLIRDIIVEKVLLDEES